MSEDEDAGEVLIEWSGFDKILRPKIAAGAAIKARVIYDGGYTDLVFVIEQLPTTKADIEATLRVQISNFADQLKAAAQGPIRVNIPDPPAKS